MANQIEFKSGSGISLSANAADKSITISTSSAIGIPTGIIAMWSGTLVNIPAGWRLCDGTNGTPNLLDKFVMGVVNSTTNPGASGGAKTVTLSVANIPAHSHTSAEHTHTLSGVSVSTAGDHTHTMSGVYGVQYPLNTGGYKVIGYNFDKFPPSELLNAGGSSSSAGAHTHSISGSVSSTTPGNTGSVGSGTAFSILPPYYALAFIMKM